MHCGCLCGLCDKSEPACLSRVGRFSSLSLFLGWRLPRKKSDCIGVRRKDSFISTDRCRRRLPRETNSLAYQRDGSVIPRSRIRVILGWWGNNAFSVIGVGSKRPLLSLRD